MCDAVTCVSSASCLCDKILAKSNLGRKGLGELQQGNPTVDPMEEQEVTLYLRLHRREVWNETLKTGF